MLAPEAAYTMIRNQGIRFFTGVPDSLLKDFCAFVTDRVPRGDHVIAANEGNAVALAMGHFLGTGEPGLVYMQNSGIGNAVNPVLSLADPEVYGIPMLLVIGWRGEPGVKDEPQHVKQGRRLTELLDAMEIPWFLLPDGLEQAQHVVAEAATRMRHRGGPVAVLVRAGIFGGYQRDTDTEVVLPLDREVAIRRIVSALGKDDVVVSTTGKASRELYEYRQASSELGADFLTVGGMGHASSIAMGIAQARPDRTVLCLDGDGAAIMHMGAMAVIGQSGLKNLVHIILNNGCHDSVGGQPTVGRHIDLTAIAKACGYRQSFSATEPNQLDNYVAQARKAEGPFLLEVHVNKGARADLGRPSSTPASNKASLMSKLRSASVSTV